MKLPQILCIAFGNIQHSEQLLRALPGYQLSFITCVGAPRWLRSHASEVGLLLMDDFLGHIDEIEHLLTQQNGIQWIALASPLTLQMARCKQLIAQHCIDFHTWPIDVARLGYSVGHAFGMASLYEEPVPGGRHAIQLIGASPAVKRLRRQIVKVGASDAPVLVWGESGTGKELVAKALHDHSRWAGGPFVAINCGAIAASLIQSELFGYARGAFSGAVADKKGLIESAAGGTLFLDEIAALPLELQSNLLRFLQEKTIYRLGSTEGVTVDTRVIAASHVRLQQAVQRGSFREDLYFRLDVLSIDVPPLRNRGRDVLPLARHFLAQCAQEYVQRPLGFDDDVPGALEAHPWPGNVRELINRVRRAAVMSESKLITAADLGLRAAPAAAAIEHLQPVRYRAERGAVEQTLKSGKSIRTVARELGVSRMTVYRLMAKHQMELPSLRKRRR